ncbi:MAG: glycosyltransferase, partial [Kiritimatiellae bacterium]|nr:glycosyltransferase [Kiritimatiellia bacterium]
MTKNDERWELTREMVGASRLSVVMPMYNLAGSVKKNLLKTAELYEEKRLRVQLVPVDDGSSDGTGGEIEEFLFENMGVWKYVQVTPVILKKNGGKGAALRAGFERAEGYYVMLLDGDLDINPRQTPYFFEQLALKDADVVIGSKRHHRSVVQYPWHRRLVSWVYFTLVRIFVGLPITDTQTGMKLFKRSVLGDALARMLVKTYAFDLELLAIAHSRGAKIAEAPVVIRFGNKFGALKPSTVRVMALDSLAVFYRLRVLRYYAHVEVPPPFERPPHVSVVIPCPNNSKMLQECIAALEAQTYTDFDIVVLPDEYFFPSLGSGRLTVLPTGKVRPAEKRNIGIRETFGEIVAFIDDDAYPDVHWLEYAVKYFSDPTIGAVGGPGVTPPGDPFPARMGGRVYDNLLVSGNYRYRYKAGGIRRDVDDYPSCNLLVRRSLLEQFGGYRTDFWPGEDTLLCKDIIDSGKRIVYDPWVVVYHHRRPLFGAHLRQLGRYGFHRGYFVKRYPSNSLHFTYFVPSLFVAYLAALAVGLAAMGCAAVALGAGAWPWLRLAACVCALPMALYVFLVLATSFSTSV